VSRTLRWNSEIQIRKRFGLPFVLSALSNICSRCPMKSYPSSAQNLCALPLPIKKVPRKIAA
jgi:hypothetical protein